MDQKGMTLIEVVMGMTLSAVIATTIAGAFVVFLLNADSATDRLSESHDAQIISAYFASDIEGSSATITKSLASGSPDSPGCADTNVVQLPLSDGSATVKYKTVSSGIERHLVRVGPTGDETVVVHNLKACSGTDNSIKTRDCLASSTQCTIDGKTVSPGCLRFDVTVYTAKETIGYLITNTACKRAT